MSLEPVVFVNGLSQVGVSVIALLLALKLRKKQNSCMLEKPFYLLSLALLVIALLNILWSFGLMKVAEADNLFVMPFFHLTVLAVWFYIGVFISGHKNIYYIIPLFIMSVNAFLLVKSFNVLADIITGLAMVGVFFYTSFVDRHMMRKVSYAGMAYGFSIICMAALAYFTKVPYINSFWFITSSVLFYILFCMFGEDDICTAAHQPVKHHIPIVVEVLKLGFFVAALSAFLMLGTLGVHELGHSLAAKGFGCFHETSFGIGFAVTHVMCESGGGTTLITLAGFIMTVLVSALIYFMGNDFAKRMSLLMFAFSMIIATDDFTALGIPNSLFVVIVFVSALLIGYGLVLIVRNYEKEYAEYEAGVATACASADCRGK
jgi:hypothetical protein